MTGFARENPVTVHDVRSFKVDTPDSTLSEFTSLTVEYLGSGVTSTWTRLDDRALVITKGVCEHGTWKRYCELMPAGRT